MSDYKPPADTDEVTPESAALHLLECVDHWQRAITDEEKQKWVKQLARLMGYLVRR